jgi:hypothetical protein
MTLTFYNIANDNAALKIKCLGVSCFSMNQHKVPLTWGLTFMEKSV